MVPILLILIVHDLTTTSGRFVLPQRNASDLSAPNDTTSGSCQTFHVGDPDKQELYSPNYPHNYPNHSDCIRILEAPSGHLLKLDFRDEFNVEPSEDCRFDYLEVRDGEHGYSPLIGKFCGHQFPPMVTSSSRHLWMRFRSDENIEYSGFRAVYTFVPRPTDGREVEVPPCRMTKSGVEGYVNRSDIPAERVLASVQYNVPLDCMWVITVEPGWKISLIFLKFSLERPNDCESNFMDVFPERTDLPSRLHNFCGSMAELVYSRGNILHLRFMVEPPAINSSFEILFTAFRDRAKDESCVEGEYDCEDATCISDTLRCNGRANCRFRWDEDDCKSEVNAMGRLLQEEHMVIILIIFFMILTGMCSAFIYNCARKLIRDTQMLKEHKEQEKAEREEEMCRKMAAATMLPISTIMPRLHDSSPSSASTSPGRINGHAHSTPNLRAPPCHVPSTGQPLDVTKLQHMSLEQDHFPRTVETYVPVEKHVTVTHSEVQTKESQLRERITSVDSLMPPPPPPPRMPTVFLETDLDFHPTFQFPRGVGPSLCHSRSDEHLPETRCSEGFPSMRRIAPDVIAAH